MRARPWPYYLPTGRGQPRLSVSATRVRPVCRPLAIPAPRAEIGWAVPSLEGRGRLKLAKIGEFERGAALRGP